MPFFGWRSRDQRTGRRKGDSGRHGGPRPNPPAGRGRDEQPRSQTPPEGQPRDQAPQAADMRGAADASATARAPGAASGAGASSAPNAGPARPIDLRLARLHLRTGALALARAELEMLAGRSALDQTGVLDLAEVRWRTGDLSGAGEAASTYVSGGGDEALAFVIAAEAAAAQDRPAEARRLAGRALEKASVSLDEIFAGISRSAIWPLDSWAAGTGAAGAGSAGTGAGTGAADAGAAGAGGPGSGRVGPVSTGFAAGSARADGAAAGGLWDASASVVDPEREVEKARAAIRASAFSDAAVHLGVALRLSPPLAALVIETIGSVHDAALEVVHGDALRLLGYEWEARRAYVSAAELAARRQDAPGDAERAGEGRTERAGEAGADHDAEPGPDHEATAGSALAPGAGAAQDAGAAAAHDAGAGAAHDAGAGAEPAQQDEPTRPDASSDASSDASKEEDS